MMWLQTWKKQLEDDVPLPELGLKTIRPGLQKGSVEPKTKKDPSVQPSSEPSLKSKVECATAI